MLGRPEDRRDYGTFVNCACRQLCYRSSRSITTFTLVSTVCLTTLNNTMGAILSVETLFWTPLAVDLMLLATTYSLCRFSGLGWFLKTMKEHSTDADEGTPLKKNDDEDADIQKLVNDKSHPINEVWGLAMIAYSAYGCLLPWATYVAYTNPDLRPSLSWAMTALMLFKLTETNVQKWNNEAQEKSKVLAIIFFYLPTYGGYAVYKSFFE